MGQRDPVLGFYGVNLQIPLFSYPHNEEKPSVHGVGQKRGGGIPAVKQQQAAFEPKLLESDHMQLCQVPLIGGVGGNLAVIDCMIQRPVGQRIQSSCRGPLRSGATESTFERLYQ